MSKRLLLGASALAAALVGLVYVWFPSGEGDERLTRLTFLFFLAVFPFAVVVGGIALVLRSAARSQAQESEKADARA